MTEVDFKYTVRPAVEADRRFIVETTARVRQPHGVTWFDWEVYGRTWSEACWNGYGAFPHVVDSEGVILGYVIGRHGVLECLFVKKDFRGLSFGQLLLDAAGMGDPVPVRAPTDSFRIWASRRGIKFTVIT